MQETKSEFRLWRLIAAVLAILLVISASAQWYARNITLPRHCENPQETLTLARRVITERTPYIKAARLTFLVPRESEEPIDSYMERLRLYLDQQCR
ncbi:MAG: hypothetical protein DIZ78_12790 [endosymbiont of Escarpia spicata]|uniref:Uncharacterized protein n=1 Tax=endosymbiont of Escarpia spicata TaxID=2200908 RepID=A0A370DH82_9GAMM|nr:MAG: hypothetical protein DIZ78_12790 [endosymbiont of Escarpia spicata]